MAEGTWKQEEPEAIKSAFWQEYVGEHDVVVVKVVVVKVVVVEVNGVVVVVVLAVVVM